MAHSIKKFISLLMLLWLPLFTSSALATSVTMQFTQNDCQSTATQSENNERESHHTLAADTSDSEQSSSCAVCDICHLASAGYLGVPEITVNSTRASTRQSAPYLNAFFSYYSAPLVPPPLAFV